MTEKTMQEIARTLRLAKQNAKLSNQNIAEAVGITNHTVNKIMHGRNANFDNYLKVLHLFGAEIEVKMPEITTRIKGRILAMRHKTKDRKEGNPLKVNQ